MAYAALTTVTAVKAWMRAGTVGTADDAQITGLIGACSELIGRFCSRENLGEVIAYADNYFPNRRVAGFRSQSWDLVLRQYPVVSVASVFINTTPVPVLTTAALQAGQVGCLLETGREPRMLKFYQVAAVDPTIIVVNYTAGYTAVPLGLAQACNQFVAEILRSATFINLKSVAIQGETTSYDGGGDFAMSKRVESMCKPYFDHCGGLGMR